MSDNVELFVIEGDSSELEEALNSYQKDYKVEIVSHKMQPCPRSQHMTSVVIIKATPKHRSYR